MGRNEQFTIDYYNKCLNDKIELFFSNRGEFDKLEEKHNIISLVFTKYEFDNATNYCVIVKKLAWVKNFKNWRLTRKIKRIVKIDKVGFNNIITTYNGNFARSLKTKKLSPTNLTNYLNVLPDVYQKEIKEKVLKQHGIDYSWIDSYSLGNSFGICSEFRRKKIYTPEDLYKKKFNFIRRKEFFELLPKLTINDNKYFLLLLIKLKISDDKSIATLRDILSKPNTTKFDTIWMATKHNFPINLKWSDKRWTVEHDNYALQTRNLALIDRRIKNEFGLTSFKKFTEFFEKTTFFKDYQFELLNTLEKLVKEGNEQNNCVASYRDSINSGHCVIYTAQVNNRKVTIQINDDLVISQIKYKFNEQFIDNFGFYPEFNKLVELFQKTNKTPREFIKEKFPNNFNNKITVVNDELGVPF